MLCRQPDWWVSVRPAKSALRDYRLPAQPSGESERAYPSHRRAHESWYSIRHASSRSPSHLFLAAPPACWWARTIALPMKTSSRLASPASSANTACHMPATDHLAKRLHRYSKVQNQAANTPWAASTRHPQHCLDKQPIVPCGSRPGSVNLPGSKGAILSYWSSLSISLGILLSPKGQDINRFTQN
jgi:hypothetical protein